MFIKNLIKRTRKETFITIYISAELSMNVEKNRILVKTIEKFNPSYWELINPEGYIVYYLKNSTNIGLSEKLLEVLSNLILKEDDFKDYKIGKSEGIMVANFHINGQLDSEPLGNAAIEATKNLIGREQLQT